PSACASMIACAMAKRRSVSSLKSSAIPSRLGCPLQSMLQSSSRRASGTPRASIAMVRISFSSGEIRWSDQATKPSARMRPTPSSLTAGTLSQRLRAASPAAGDLVRILHPLGLLPLHGLDRTAHRLGEGDAGVEKLVGGLHRQGPKRLLQPLDV